MARRGGHVRLDVAVEHCRLVVIGGVLLGLHRTSVKYRRLGPTTHLGQGIDSLCEGVRKVTVLDLDFVLGVSQLQLLAVFCVGRRNQQQELPVALLQNSALQ